MKLVYSIKINDHRANILLERDERFKVWRSYLVHELIIMRYFTNVLKGTLPFVVDLICILLTHLIYFIDLKLTDFFEKVAQGM